MKWNFPLVFFVAILVPGSRGQSCRISGKTHIDIHDCNSESYFNLFGKNDTAKIVNINAGNKNNKFPEIDGKMFRNMTNLTELTLYNCSIESIDQNAFTNLKALETLRLADNKLTKLDENIFRNLVNLRDLNLIQNQITELPQNLLKNSRNLTYFWMGENKIQEIPRGFFDNFTELGWISLNKNELEVIHQNTFKKNRKLKKLLLDSNKIYAIADGAFDELSNMTQLNLANNPCIKKEYGSWGSTKSVNLTQVSADLDWCYNIYENLVDFFKPTTTEAPQETSTNAPENRLNSVELEPPINCSCNCSDLLLIIASISTAFLIVLIIFIITLVRKCKRDDTPEIRSQNIAMPNRDSHYYSTPDLPGQFEPQRKPQLQPRNRVPQKSGESYYSNV
jgi:hypothetical protein